MVIRRFDVHLVSLDPTVGSEVRKTRPCAIVSPDEMNSHLATVIVAPLTTSGSTYPSRISCEFAGTSGYVVLDQLRCVRRHRLIKRLGQLASEEQEAVLSGLAAMFAR